MLSITVGSNMNRTTVQDTVDTTPKELLSNNNVSTQGATIYLNGMPLSVTDLSASMSDLGCNDGEDVTLIAVVKADSAM